MKSVRVVLLLALFVVGGAVGYGQSLRSVVALVKPKISDEARAGFNKIAASFEDQGYKDLAEYFQSWAKGGHGSGVLIQDLKGNVILVTNRHVASFCETVDVSFRAVDGTETVWPDCPVLYTDPLVDLAFIGVPKGTTAFLPLAKAVTEGTDVWSAGFPGLAGRPEWQLAKGTVTNASVSLPELGNEKDAVFYQHSASIDPGNSGGPLLLGDPTKLASLGVLGINSYSVSNRNNTFFSVPSSKILEALKRYSEVGQAQLNDSSATLAKFLNATDWDKFGFRTFVSYHYASAEGWDEFQKAARTMTTKDRSLWYGRFFDSPLDALSQFLSYQLWQKVRGASDALTYVDTDRTAPAAPVGTFTLGKDKVLVTWVQEGGQWKIAKVQWPGTAAPVAKANDTPAAGTSIPVGTSLVLTGVDPTNNSWSSSLGLGIEFRNDFRFLGPTFANAHFGFIQDSPGKNDYASSPPVNTYNFIEAGTGVGYFYTVRFPGGGYIAPYGVVDADLVFAFPLFQSSIGTAASSNGGSNAVFNSLLLAGALAPRIGLEWSPDEYWALGADVGVRWYAFGLSGLKSIPVSIYFKSTSLQ